MNETNGKTKCLYPGCAYYSCSRGLCASHYQAARRYVNAGKATWEQLEKAGKCRNMSNNRSGIHGFWKGWSMSDKMMVIPLRVPRQTGIDWKVEAVKQG